MAQHTMNQQSMYWLLVLLFLKTVYTVSLTLIYLLLTLGTVSQYYNNNNNNIVWYGSVSCRLVSSLVYQSRLKSRWPWHRTAFAATASWTRDIIPVVRPVYGCVTCVCVDVKE
jgi:hypothetical protein